MPAIVVLFAGMARSYKSPAADKKWNKASAGKYFEPGPASSPYYSG